MTCQHYCVACGMKLSLNDAVCPNCGEATLFSPIDGEVVFNPPIHNIGFFDFDIDFSPYINRPKVNTNFYICSNCGYLNGNDNDFCFACGEKRNKRGFRKIFNRLSRETPRIGSITCRTCGEINSSENNFCEFCGESLGEVSEEKNEENEFYSNFASSYDHPIFCFCGQENDIDSQYCIRCGFPLHRSRYEPDNFKVLCTCGSISDIYSERCGECGTSLDHENEINICSCGMQNSPDAKYCISCRKPLNPERTIRTRYICTCGAFLDYSAAFCENCGRKVSASIKNKRSVIKRVNSLKKLKRRFL